jgi:hypothetical protein
VGETIARSIRDIHLGIKASIPRRSHGGWQSYGGLFIDSRTRQSDVSPLSRNAGKSANEKPVWREIFRVRNSPTGLRFSLSHLAHFAQLSVLGPAFNFSLR